MFNFWSKKEETISDDYKIVSIYFDEHVISMSLLEIKKEKAEVLACETHDANQKEIQLELLSRFVAKYECHKLDCSVTLPFDDYLINLMELPEYDDEDKIKNEIRKQIKEETDLKSETLIIDYFNLPVLRASDKRKMIYTIAAEIPVITKCVEMVKGAGLKPKYIDIPELAIRNLANLTNNETEGCIVLFLDESGGLMVLSKNSSLHVIRHMNLDLSKLLPDASAFEVDEDKIHEIVDNLALEVQRSLDYCSNIFRIIPSKSILLLPSELQLKKIKSVLEEDLNLPVNIFSAKEYLNIDEQFIHEIKQKTLLTIGAGLRTVVKEEIIKEAL